jgi:hypothetical protein
MLSTPTVVIGVLVVFTAFALALAWADNATRRH